VHAYLEVGAHRRLIRALHAPSRDLIRAQDSDTSAYEEELRFKIQTRFAQLRKSNRVQSAEQADACLKTLRAEFQPRFDAIAAGVSATPAVGAAAAPRSPAPLPAAAAAAAAPSTQQPRRRTASSDSSDSSSLSGIEVDTSSDEEEDGKAVEALSRGKGALAGAVVPLRHADMALRNLVRRSMEEFRAVLSDMHRKSV